MTARCARDTAGHRNAARIRIAVPYLRMGFPPPVEAYNPRPMPRLLAAALALVLSGPSPEAPSRFATLDGHRIHYQVAGSGPQTLVFVHGWSCDLSVWRLQVPAFASKARVIVLD